MSRNIAVTPGTGATVSTDEITQLNGSGIAAEQIQRVKLSFGAVGTATDVVSGSPLPVSGTVTANAGTGTFAVSAASLPLPTGAATAAGITSLAAQIPSSLGTKAASGSLAVTLASDGPFITSIGSPSDAAAANGATGTLLAYSRAIKDAVTDTTSLSPVRGPGKYQTVAASTTQACGTGAVGDYLEHVLIIPASTSPGAVQIKDGSGSAVTVFAGGASSLTNLASFTVPLDIVSTSGGWSVITNASVSAIAVGKF